MNISTYSLDVQWELFGNNLSRQKLLDFQPSGNAHYKASVYRNHSFELIEHTIHPFLSYSGISVEFKYSDYDDSLSFLGLDTDTDFLIVWLDAARYKVLDFNAFLRGRLEVLKDIYKKPILVAVCGAKKEIETDARFLWIDTNEIESELKGGFWDERLEKYSGTRLSSKACLGFAQVLGLKYIPAAVAAGLKVIVTDLDNTLYRGVLGEDRPEGIQLTEGHKHLQMKLSKLAAEGFLLCIASKNEPEDVQNLFGRRQDFPLKWTDFAKTCVSWNEKSRSIEEICRELNVGTDSVVFIDDNIGELMAVRRAHPEVKEIWAAENGDVTTRILRLFPGLLKTDIKFEDSIRKKDLQANLDRQKLQQGHSAEEYLKELAVKIIFSINNSTQLPRVAELSNKTNQFIFNYMRYSLADLDERIRSGEYAICAVSLEDRLSDSGIIGVCVLRKQNGCAHLEECFVSCRALGRGLDEIIVLGAIRFSMDVLKVNRLRTAITEGERNRPARDFFEKCLNEYMETEKEFVYKIPEGLVEVIYKSNM